jgi:hypothetical protein
MISFEFLSTGSADGNIIDLPNRVHTAVDTLLEQPFELVVWHRHLPGRFESKQDADGELTDLLFSNFLKNLAFLVWLPFGHTLR